MQSLFSSVQPPALSEFGSAGSAAAAAAVGQKMNKVSAQTSFSADGQHILTTDDLNQPDIKNN